MAYDDRMNYEHYYLNCIYNYIEASQVLNFEKYNVSAKLGMIYACIIKYSDLLFFSKHQKLFVANPTRGPQIIVD